MIKKLVAKIKNWKNNFKKATLFNKTLMLLLLIVQIDVTVFIFRNTYSYMDYEKRVILFNKNIVEQEKSLNKKLILELKNNKSKANNNVIDESLIFEKISKLKKTNKLTFQEILIDENIYKNIDNIFVVPSNEEFVNIKVVFKNNKSFIINNIQKYSFIHNIEPQLMIKSIDYIWTSTLGEIDNKNTVTETFLKPEFKFLPFIFIPLILHEFFTFLLILLMLYMLEKSGTLSSGQTKFEILLPENIKGDINDLIGMEDIKEDMSQLKDLIYDREKYKKMGIDKTFNIMFSGPPGVGKTKLASFLSKTLNIPMIIGTGNVETGYLAGGANVLKELFKTARAIAAQNSQKTCIIFLDEAQVLLRKRGQGREKWADDSSNELLAQLDGVNTKDEVDIIFIAASNFDDSNMEMDEAMERRFKKKIFFRLPNRDEREKIFEFYLNKIEEEFKEKIIDYKYISEITSRLSPAKIETIVQKAGMISIKDKKLISTEILVKAFENIMIGDTTRKTTEKQEDVRKIIIYHELGHFITDLDNKIEKYGEDFDKIKDNIKILKISSESIAKYNALGYVLNTEEEVGLKTKKDLENDIISLYGGLAAEVHFLNNDNDNTDNITTGSFNDIEKVSHTLKHMVMDLGMFSNNKINLNILNLKNDESSIKIIEEVSERLFNSSLEKIKKHEGLINHIFPILLDKWVLSKEELFKCIKSYYYPEKEINLLFDIEKYKSLEFSNEIKNIEEPLVEKFSIFNKN